MWRARRDAQARGRGVTVDFSALSSEERQAVGQLVRSPGWYVVMRDYILPSIQSASARLDALSGVTQSQADIMRGIKHAYRQLIEGLYRVAELPNPFEHHAEAFVAAVARYANVSQEPPEDSPSSSSQSPPLERSKRVSYPV